jgi:Cys-rich repeat protein
MPGTAGTTGSGGAPSGCTSNAMCSGQTALCDTSTGRCVQCLSNTNCGRGQTCNLATHTCGSGTSSGLSACISNPGAQVAILGDSFVTGATSPQLQPELATKIQTAIQYGNFAVAGAAMASGGMSGLISTQLQQALAAHPQLKLLIMDGGDNDLLACNATQFAGCQTDCGATGATQHQECKDIVAAATTSFGQVLTTATNAGIKDIVYFSYPHLPQNNGGYDEILDYANSQFQQVCDGALQTTGGKLACHFVDLVQPFIQAGGDRNPANFTTPTAPSAAGQNIIATQIANTMQSACLGQSSGCCSP